MSVQNLADLTQLSSEEINGVRHKWERPLYKISVAITIIAVIVLLIGIALSVSGYLPDGDSDKPNSMTIIILLPVIIIFTLYQVYAKTRAYAIRVSEKNFPEIYQKSVEFAGKLGMKNVPAVYIRQVNGALNAFAASIIGRRYIQINAEFVDIAYLEHRDFNTVYFVLAHEFGHQYCKHTTIQYLLMTIAARFIPIFKSLLSRAQEYSADRIAQLLMGRDCADSAMTMIAGRHLYKYVKVEDYLDDAKDQKGFFMWLVNLTASHPILPKRIAALADPERKSGKLL